MQKGIAEGSLPRIQNNLKTSQWKAKLNRELMSLSNQAAYQRKRCKGNSDSFTSNWEQLWKGTSAEESTITTKWLQSIDKTSGTSSTSLTLSSKRLCHWEIRLRLKTRNECYSPLLRIWLQKGSNLLSISNDSLQVRIGSKAHNPGLSAKVCNPLHRPVLARIIEKSSRLPIIRTILTKRIILRFTVRKKSSLLHLVKTQKITHLLRVHTKTQKWTKSSFHQKKSLKRKSSLEERALSTILKNLSRDKNFNKNPNQLLNSNNQSICLRCPKFPQFSNYKRIKAQ